jgi:membrane protease YdiL (CAAX protease family)
MGAPIQDPRGRNVVLAGALGASVVLAYFSGSFYATYLSETYEPILSHDAVFVIAAAGAVLAAAVAGAVPRVQTRLLRVLAVTTLIYLIWRFGVPWVFWLSWLTLTPDQKYWVYRGPGGGALGQLPSAVTVLLVGRFLYGMSLREQWSGRLVPTLRDLWYGGSVGVGMSALVLGGAALAGAGRVAWEPNWAQNGVNVFSNLYEEVMARSLLLQVVRREAGDRFAMFWTGLVFGTMHGVNWFAVGVALTTWVIAWIVLRSGSLWAGWVFHQTIDVLVDSSLH